MSIPGKVLIALLCAAIIAAAWAYQSTDLSFIELFLPSATAALLAVLLTHRALPMPAAIAATATTTATSKKPESAPAKGKRPTKQDKKPTKKPKESKPKAASAARGKQETGTVKWFNGSKGFGFIVRDSGEEIFVHHRSIVGEGRRNLRDGSTVRFRVADTDKGPQAEDVEPLDDA